MSRVIDKQKCFHIPKGILDLFLVKLQFSNDRLLHVEAEYIFDAKDHYDVVVNYYGSYPFVENQIEEFVTSLNTKRKKKWFCK